MSVRVKTTFTVFLTDIAYVSGDYPNDLIDELLKVQAWVIQSNELGTPIGVMHDYVHGVIAWTFDNNESAEMFANMSRNVQRKVNDATRKQ